MRNPVTGLRARAVVRMAAPAGAVAVLMAAGPAPAETVGRGRADAVRQAGSAGASLTLPSTGGSVADGGSDHGKDGGDKASPPEIRHRLEFTGAVGWPDLAIGCFFDPDSKGADRHGRRVVCVETVVRPPVFGPTRIRGRHHRP